MPASLAPPAMSSAMSAPLEDNAIEKRLEALRLANDSIPPPPPIAEPVVDKVFAPPPPVVASAPVQSPVKQQRREQGGLPPSTGIELNSMSFANLYPTLEQPRSVSVAPPPSFEETVRRNPAPTETVASSINLSSTSMNSDILRQQQEIMSRIHSEKARIQKATSSSSSSSTTTATTTTGIRGQEATTFAREEECHLVQCTGCSGWMKVIKKATLVFCPTCQVVSHVATANTKEATVMRADDASGLPALTGSLAEPGCENDEALAMALEAQWNEEEEEEVESNEVEVEAADELAGIDTGQSHPRPLTASQQAMHESLRDVGGRTVSGGEMFDCLRGSVVTAGSTIRGFFTRSVPEEVRIPAVRRNNAGESTQEYSRLDDEEEL